MAAPLGPPLDIPVGILVYQSFNSFSKLNFQSFVFHIKYYRFVQRIDLNSQGVFRLIFFSVLPLSFLSSSCSFSLERFMRYLSGEF